MCNKVITSAKPLGAPGAVGDNRKRPACPECLLALGESMRRSIDWRPTESIPEDHYAL